MAALHYLCFLSENILFTQSIFLHQVIFLPIFWFFVFILLVLFDVYEEKYSILLITQINQKGYYCGSTYYHQQPCDPIGDYFFLKYTFSFFFPISKFKKNFTPDNLHWSYDQKKCNQMKDILFLFIYFLLFMCSVTPFKLRFCN